ncbi:MAG: coiled-coil domain-containing protein [Mycolicibacterium sp.]|uniref:coiled-coil domain-containing protein n=1 Tax=Mycolicibacterium sp. TaxID=2320850 RepID=UPI003D13692A
MLAFSVAADVQADPAADALSRLNDLAGQAVQTREAVSAAQADLDVRLAAQRQAEERHRADRAALEVATSQTQTYQAAVDRVAAMTYTSGRTGWMAAVLTADSPQQLIDQIWAERAIPAEMARQTVALLSARARTEAAVEASQRSSAEARAAAERSAAVHTDLQSKWRELQRQIAAAEAQYAALTPQQRAVFDNPRPPAPAPAAPPPPVPTDPTVIAMPAQPPLEVASPIAAIRADIPESLPVGVAREAGLQPNTIVAARAISARFPQIATIDGVRPDPKPWHPNGLAIDVMIPNPESPEGIALGDEILAFVMANAGRFGLQDAIWRGTYYTPAGPQAAGYGHFDHVHITTRPSR